MFHQLSLWRCSCGSLEYHNHFHMVTLDNSHKFHEVLNCLCKLGKNNIKPRDPNFSKEHERVKENFWPNFKWAIGAIAGSHVPVIIPQDEVVSHTSQNVLAICDFDKRFLFVVVDWSGSKQPDDQI